MDKLRMQEAEGQAGAYNEFLEGGCTGPFLGGKIGWSGAPRRTLMGRKDDLKELLYA